ncbi:MAG: hypothetical protein ACRCU9_16265, partial [Iodobacter sp.]
FGMIQDITGENQPDKKWQAAMGSLKMDEIQFTAMVDAAMPDSILSTIRDEYSSILLPYSSGDQYRRVVQGIKDAKELHLHGSQDILQMALIQLMSAEDPQTSSEYQRFKNKIKSGDELADSINHLPAEFWRKNN